MSGSKVYKLNCRNVTFSEFFFLVLNNQRGDNSVSLADWLTAMGPFHLTTATLTVSFHLCCSPKVKQKQMMLASIEVVKWNAPYVGSVVNPTCKLTAIGVLLQMDSCGPNMVIMGSMEGVTTSPL
ncbi:uncharacterized protein LOC115233206 isoform X2 [Formica exsecta]|uniref:uncharacterized protein LOC115233206 isoform X2 n=1 Tax=Formica exsecta TaxID=72781 RepID=UPI0011427A4A|nr:uncharacterized protein LOC115233206 isoform X2 [Formica exsecta]